jgi:hypothetical protein
METTDDHRGSDVTGHKQGATRFQPGQSGNPNGRPRGSRNKLSEEFLSDLQHAWSQHGPDALAKCATGDPVAFCKIVGNLIPRQFESSLHVSLTAEFEAAASFAEAWKVVKQAKSLIGAKPVIELEAERRDAELSDD